MINFNNCRNQQLDILKHDVEKLRSRPNDYSKDEIFTSIDHKYIILCHTISEGSMNAYYTQLCVFRNDDYQHILISTKKIWSPLWTKNFWYYPENEEIAFSITCYDRDTKINPLPTLIVNLHSIKMTMIPKEKSYHQLNEHEKDKLIWTDFRNEIDFCEEYKINTPYNNGEHEEPL